MAVGVIAEYNPFHNGHMYHLNKIKEMFPNEEIVAVISSSFTQRGEPSIINKWDKTDICLKAGIDLVIELPYVFSTESADYFSYGALTILEKLGVDKFVFGSETNDIDIFKKIVDIQLNNDLLGISYVKIIKENNYKIKPFCIKRTSDYNSLSIDNNISSATAIRKALEENKDVSSLVPDFVLEKFSELHFKENYFKFLKYKIMLDDNLERYQTVDEGLGFKLKKEIISSTSYDELIEKIKSKRYTQNRINRMLNHILCDFTKEKKSKCQNLEYIRILGFNDKGQIFINKNKKKCDLPIISNFSKNKSAMMEQEFIATLVYASILDEKRKKELIEKEYKYHPKYEEKMNNE